MAQRRRKRKSKKWISRLFFLVLLIIAVVLCYFVWDAYFKDKSPKKPDASDQSTSQEEEPKKEEEEKPKEEEEELEEKPKVPQYDGDDPNTANDLTGVITYIGMSNGYLRIRVNVDQYVNGGCNIILSRGGTEIYNDYANLVASASTSTCEGFDIPVAGLGSGNTQIRITLSSGSKTGAITGEATL